MGLPAARMPPKMVTDNANGRDMFAVWRLIGLLARALIAALVLLSAPGQGADARPKTITVVLDDNYPPYIFRNPAGKLQGILKDQWALWSQRTGIAVELVATDWAKAQQIMREGRADVIDTIFQTEERRKNLEFSRPYANLEVLVFFHHSISGIVDAESLKGFSVGVKDGDACIDELQKHGIAGLLRYPSYEALVRAATLQEIRLFCIDKPPGIYLLYKHGQEAMFRHTAPLNMGAFHRAVRKGDAALLAIVEQGFAAITEDEYRAIDERWMGSPLFSQERREQLRLALKILAVVAALVVFLGIWNFSLRQRVVKRTTELTEAMQEMVAARIASEHSRDQLAATLAALPDLLFELDLEGRYLDYRAGNEALLAAPPEQLMGRTVAEVMPAETAGIVLEALQSANVAGSSHGAQICLDLPSGRHWFELSVAKKASPPGELPRFIVISRDVSERQRAQAEIERLAFFDPLTQLPNRRLLHERLRQELAASLRRGSHGALLFIDLDDFKTLNDTRGHKTGDLLLGEMARRLHACVRVEDTVARLGGDEFVLMLEDLSRDPKEAATQAEGVAEKVLRAVAVPCLLEGYEHHATASIGICLFSGVQESEDELLKRADAAMYRAKHAGRNSIRFFDPAMQAALEARARMESELRRALPARQFLLYYQPQFDSEQRMVGAEALIRWQHPERGLVMPGQFIPLAEESGLIVEIGEWVLETACEHLRCWADRPETRHLKLSVNVSARQFRQPEFVAGVRDILAATGVDPTQLKLELTESLVLDNVGDTIERMHAVKALGVRFSMDDFGTGYSSLSYLRRLPLDQLKIDQSFVRDIVSDPGNAVIVQTIIAMAGTLGMSVIAEGVETEAQRAFLLRHGCRVYQGFLFSPPVPLAEFEALI